ncbi:MAG: NUDIX hydrolase [Candidatus Gracilibacteria bacterium]
MSTVKEYQAIFTTRALIIHENKLLIVRHSNPHSTYYALPGGKLEGDESLINGLKREIYEELNINAEIGPLALVHEFIHPIYGGRRIEFFYTIQNTHEFLTLQNQENNTSSHAFEISEILWVDIADIANGTIDLKPYCLRDLFKSDQLQNIQSFNPHYVSQY